MISPHVYTTVEVAQATGFTIRQLDHWAKLGIPNVVEEVMR